MKGYTLVVKGKVQGVGFRYFTKMIADSMHLHGMVMNLDDGTVYIETDCDESVLMALLERLRTAPPEGRVDDIVISEEDVGEFHDFKIRQ